MGEFDAESPKPVSESEIPTRPEPQTAKIVLCDIKDSDGWGQLADVLGVPEEIRNLYFKYGEFANIEIIVDRDLKIVGGRLLPNREIADIAAEVAERLDSPEGKARLESQATASRERVKAIVEGAVVDQEFLDKRVTR